MDKDNWPDTEGLQSQLLLFPHVYVRPWKLITTSRAIVMAYFQTLSDWFILHPCMKQTMEHASLTFPTCNGCYILWPMDEILLNLLNY